MEQSPENILSFWFKEIDPKLWFAKSDAFDRTIREKFSEVHRQAIAGELFFWRKNPQGRLAEIIILDQFSRNLFRNTPGAFFADFMALALSQEGISVGADKKLQAKERAFFYMPFMHSESQKIHEIAEKLFSAEGLEYSYEYELKHKKIIDRFSRFPHRNEILGRTSVPEEIEFLAGPDSSF